MKLTKTLLAWTLAPVAVVAACDSGPCEETRSCGEYMGPAGGAAGTAGSSSSGGAQGHGGSGKGFAGETSAGMGGEGGAFAGGAGGQSEVGAQGGAESMGGEAGSAGAGGSAPICDVSGSPSEEPCLVSDQYALFVAPTGSDEAPGTQAAPLRSISKALDTAASTGQLIIACSATYDESISLHAGARIFGGFACPSLKTPWAYLPGTRARLAPLVAGPALTIQAVKQPVLIEDFEFQSQNATTPAGSSIAAMVVSSSQVTLRRSRLVAGNGAAGADGAKGADGADGDLPVSDQRGGDAVCGPQAPTSRDGGRWFSASTCGSRGGSGGQAQNGDRGFAGATGTPQTNVVPEGVNNRGDEAPSTPVDAPGGDGKAGSPGKAGAAGKATPDQSTFTDKGFTPSLAGGNGSDGFPGQGGGGGAASNGVGACIGASGGAGGMGGCGGKAAGGGASGGASLSLLSWQSGVTLDDCELVAGNGGAGGKGGDGGAGGNGRLGGDGGVGVATAYNNIGPGGKGGRGGNGGAGGPGAGGNGGPSYALVFHGTAPVKLSNTVLTVGNGGAAGPGGASGSLHGENGNTGRAALELNVP